MKNITWQDITNDKLLLSLVIALGVAALFMIIMQITVAIIYVKTSWINRNNSKDMTGGELARNILDQEGMKDTELKSSFFYIKYWNHSRIRNTFRLRPWTVNRKSIWTLTESAQQTVVSTWRKQKGKMGMAFGIFRIPTILNVISVILSLVTIGYVFFALKAGGALDLHSTQGKRIITIVVLVFTIVATLVAWADVLKMSIIRKHVTPILLKQGFTDKEMKQFKLIYTSRLILAVAIAIYNTIRLLIQILNIINGKKGN